MLRTQGLILLSLIYCLLIAAAVFMPSYGLLMIPAGLSVTAVVIHNKRASHKRKIDEIQKRLSNLRSEGLIIEEKVKESEGDAFFRMILTLLTDLERLLFKLVEKNIQFLSLKEIGRNIINSMDENKLIDSVFEYLIHGVGYREVAFIFLRKEKKCFQAVVCIEKTNSISRRVINLEINDLKGVLYDSFVSGKSFLVRDADIHPLLNSESGNLFPGSTMTSYICVPLVKTSERTPCCSEGKCCREIPESSGTARSGRDFMSSLECLSCHENPVLGAVIVTDGFRATPLTKIDQVTIETVGSLVASNIENWMLYQELRQEEIFREKILECMQHGLFVTDLEGNITLANRSALEMCGYNDETVRKTKIYELLYDGAYKKGDNGILPILNGKTPSIFHDAFLKRFDGAHIPLRMNVSQLYGNEGDVQGTIILFVDLSEIRRMELEIRQMDKLAVLGRFTSAIAHEIRNPLTGIGAGIQYLQRKGGLSEEQTENISFILNEVDRLNRIITDLFKVAKPRELLYQKIEIDCLIERSWKSLSEQFSSKNIEFISKTDDNLETIEIDVDQITQVLINLMKNSAEAVSEGGIIEIKTSLYGGEDPDVPREKQGGLVCIEVHDNGSGIPKRDIGKVFEPFFSKKAGGTGLGLFVTHGIILHHHGRISVLSEPGRGTTFKVYLPVSRPTEGGKVETGSTSG